jgi:predicted TIM-barrel fold metal-dependent hydrolase
MIIDSQVHMWLPETPTRPWPAGFAARAQLPFPFSYETMIKEMDGAGVDAAIFVPPTWEGARNDYGEEAIRRHPGRFALMGRIALDDPAAPRVIPTWRDVPGRLGFRLTFSREQAGWLKDGTADWFWPAAEKADIPVMIKADDMMDRVEAIARDHPGLTLIVDHLGLSTAIAKAGGIDQAIDRTVALARYPNALVKVSSAPAYSFEPWPFRDLDKAIHLVIEAFGPQRCCWGTDLTNSYSKCTYRERLTHFTETLGLGAEDLDWILGKALLQALRWRPTSPN